MVIATNHSRCVEMSIISFAFVVGGALALLTYKHLNGARTCIWIFRVYMLLQQPVCLYREVGVHSCKTSRKISKYSNVLPIQLKIHFARQPIDGRCRRRRWFSRGTSRTMHTFCAVVSSRLLPRLWICCTSDRNPGTKCAFFVVVAFWGCTRYMRLAAHCDLRAVWSSGIRLVVQWLWLRNGTHTNTEQEMKRQKITRWPPGWMCNGAMYRWWMRSLWIALLNFNWIEPVPNFFSYGCRVRFLVAFLCAVSWLCLFFANYFGITNPP